MRGRGLMQKINLLLTSAGRRVELVRAFRDAYRELELDGNIVALDIDPLAPAFRLADKQYIVPRLNSPDYVPTLVQICRREEIGLVLPLIDPDIPVLAQAKPEIEETGTKVGAVSSEAAETTADKWLTRNFFERIGLRTPASWLPEALPADMAFPVFIKPRRGSAGHNTFRVNTPAELDFFTRYIPQPIIQQLLEGPEITSDVICDVTGEVLGAVSRRRIEVRWGEVQKGVTVFSQEIMAACLKVAKELPACGPLTLQCMMHRDVPYFTEINARLGGGVPLGIAAGVNGPAMLLARAAGIEREFPPLGAYKTDLYMTRYDDSFFLDRSAHDEMARHTL
jgi:carbamoyl-phosphate synthase large subunit